MIHHVVTGDLAADAIKNSLPEQLTSNEHAMVVVKDIFNVGPVLKRDGQRFSDLRSLFWQEVLPNEKHPVVADDLERLLLTCNELSKFESHEIWIWLGALPADLCTYYLLIKYACKYGGKIKVINIAGLPFLDDQGKLFFPKSISGLNTREIIKALKLVRTITSGELEADSEEWDRLVRENGGVRVLEGTKKILSKPVDFYDKQLLANCAAQYQKASKIVGLAMSQFNLPVGDLFLGWRLRKMAEDGKLQMQGDFTRSLKEFEIKLHDGTLL